MEKINLDTININSEQMLAIVLYGDNRSNEVINWHKKVMVDHFGLKINYVKAPFPMVSHGACMNQILASVDLPNAPHYYWFLDNDSIILSLRAFNLMYEIVKNKITLFGHAWNSSHKIGPNGTSQHPYASQACLCFSRQLYLDLGRPNCDHNNPRSDTAEELTYTAEEKGYNLSLIYPSHSDTKTTALSNGLWYGKGNIYGPSPGLFYHESRADLPEHEERFVKMCQNVIDGKFDS